MAAARRAQLVAQLADPPPASAYAGIDVPVLLLSGARPRACTRRIAQLLARILARTLPRLEWRQLDGVGHMGLGSHPEEVDREIEDFLARHLSSRTAIRSRQRPSRRWYLRAAAALTGRMPHHGKGGETNLSCER